MHRLSNNSICSLHPPGPWRRGAGRGGARLLPGLALPSLPPPRFPWQCSLFLVGGKGRELGREHSGGEPGTAGTARRLMESSSEPSVRGKELLRAALLPQRGDWRGGTASSWLAELPSGI